MLLVSGEMDLANHRRRHGIDEGVRIEMVIDAAHVDIIHVEQQLTAGIA
jgi:hypothetical protein